MYFILLFIFIYLCTICTWTCGVPKRTSDLQELELQSCTTMWVLGIKRLRVATLNFDTLRL